MQHALISSEATGFYKVAYLVAMVALALGSLLVLVAWPFAGPFNIADGLFPLGLAICSYFIYTRVIVGHVDEVWDDGQSLLVKKGRRQARIDLRDIERVTYSWMRDPPWVTLSLRVPTIFGTKISFWGPHRFHLGWCTVIEELVKRVDAVASATKI